MEDIVKSVREAEAQAAKLRADAVSRAAVITAEADERAASLLASAEKEDAQFFETAVFQTEREAEEEYCKEISARRKEAEDYADKLLKDTKPLVNRILRRVCGDC